MSELGSSEARRIWAPTIAVAVLGLALVLPGLGESGLWDPWEPKYAQAAREMSERGDWVVPYYREDPRLNRPPVTYWLIGIAHAALGIDEATARLPSALLAVLCPVALAFAFARRARPLEGFLAGAALLTSPQWLLLGRFATLAMPLAAFLGTALALGVAAGANMQRHRRLLLGGAALLSVAAAGLTNWPRGLLLPAWALAGWAAVRLGWRGVAALTLLSAVYHTAQLTHSVALNLVAIALALAVAAWTLRSLAGISLRAQILGAACLAAVVAPWFLVVYRLQPDEISFLRYKYAFNLGESAGSHTGPYAFVLSVIAVGALPWIGAAAVGVVAAFGRARDELARVLVGLCLGTVLFFVLAEPRMGHFYAVVQPVVAALAAIGTVAAARRGRWHLLTAGVVVMLAWLLVWFEPRLLLKTATVKASLFDVDPLPLATLGAAAWLGCLLSAGLARRAAWTVVGVLPAALIVVSLSWQSVPALESMKSMKPYWTRYVHERGPGEPVGLYGQAKASAFYYSNNGAQRLKGTDELRDFLAGPSAKFLIVSRRSYGKLETFRRLSGGTWKPLETSHPTHLLVRYAPGRPTE